MYHSTIGSRRIGSWIALALTALFIAPALEAGGLAERQTRVLEVPVGRSRLLHFQRMKRVQVVEPTKVEVVVGSLDDLSLFGKAAGETTVYVWDKLGMHQLDVTVVEYSAAEEYIEQLRGILGPGLTFRTAGPNAVVVEGRLPAAAAQRAHQIIAASSRGNVQVVDLIASEGDENGATVAGSAASIANVINQVIGKDAEYTVWNDTLIVRGGVGSQERLAQARKLLAALSTPQMKIVDLLEYSAAAAEPPVEQIAQALGTGFRVWQVAGRTVAVEGTVASQQQLDNLNQLLAAFGDQAQIVNLVRVGKENINEAVAELQQLLGNRVVVRPLDGQAVVLEGNVANEATLTRLREIVTANPVGYRVIDLLRLAPDEKRQVLVQVRVVDVNKGDLKRLGINWGQLSFDDNQVSFVDQPWLFHTLSSALADNGPLGNVLSLGAQLDLLRQRNAARVLSEPNLLVDDGGKATILVGGEIPVPIAQVGGGGLGASVTVEWKPFGVNLAIEPTILDETDKINIKVSPEVSSLDFSNAVSIGGFSLPALRTRKASTVVTMKSTNTLALGGLIQNEDARIVRKLPFLGDLPVIGKLFRREEFQRNESELIILITPCISDGKLAVPATSAAERTLPSLGLPPLTPETPPAVR